MSNRTELGQSGLYKYYRTQHESCYSVYTNGGSYNGSAKFTYYQYYREPLTGGSSECILMTQYCCDGFVKTLIHMENLITDRQKKFKMEMLEAQEKIIDLRMHLMDKVDLQQLEAENTKLKKDLTEMDTQMQMLQMQLEQSEKERTELKNWQDALRIQLNGK